MRCDDCLPLIEEYFDGEVEETTAARMGAHLAACATCASALDALSFEQEIYARYDRGFEAGPDLWARVSAEIAREPQPESPAARRPFLSGVRERLAFVLGAFAARPALASSLALLIVGVAVGSLWLSRPSQEQQPAATNEVASSAPAVTPVVPRIVTPPVPEQGGVEVPVQKDSGSLNGNVGDTVPAAHETAGGGSREVARVLRTVEIAPGYVIAEDDVREASGHSPSAPPANPQHRRTSCRPSTTSSPTTRPSRSSTPRPRREAVAGERAAARPGSRRRWRATSSRRRCSCAPSRTRARRRPTAVDVAYEKNLSRKLLAQNATLQLEAEVKGDKGDQAGARHHRAVPARHRELAREPLARRGALHPRAREEERDRRRATGVLGGRARARPAHDT